MNRIVFSALALAGAIVTPALAHHSGAMFAQDKTLHIEGTVKGYRYEMPHTWISVVSTASGGKAVQWDVEGGGVTAMKKMGLTPATLRPGLKVGMDIHPLKDGRNGGSMVNLVLDGKTYAQSYADSPYGTGRSDDEGGARVKER